MTKRYALIDSTGSVNVVIWDGIEEYHPNGMLIDINNRPEIDSLWTFEDGEFIAPEYDDLPIDVIDSAHVRNDTARIDELEAQVAQLLKLLEGKS